MDNAKQTLAALTKLMKELEVLSRSIDLKRVEFTELVNTQLKKLDNVTKHIEAETVLIHEVPNKLSDQLVSLIPAIAEELSKMNRRYIDELRQEHEDSVRHHNKAITDAALNLQKLKEDITKIDGARIKRYMMTLGSVMLISVLASLGSSYAMIQRLPNNVHIDSPSNVTVERSTVSLWYSKNVNTQK